MKEHNGMDVLTLINSILGPNKDELVLAKSSDARVKRYLIALEFSRFILLPLNLAILLVIAVGILVGMISDFVTSVFAAIFRFCIDSRWMSVSWFGMTDQEIITTYENLKGSKNG